MGSSFLENTRLVITFCVRGASFRLTYGRNILLLVVGGRALVGKVHTRILKAFDPNVPPRGEYKYRNIDFVAQGCKDTEETTKPVCQ